MRRESHGLPAAAPQGKSLKSGVSLLALFILLLGSDSTLLKLLQHAGVIVEAAEASMTDLAGLRRLQPESSAAVAEPSDTTGASGKHQRQARSAFFIHTE
jgi:hypothetical protein